MNATLLITGPAGGLGRHLLPVLRRQRGIRLVGLGRGPKPNLLLDEHCRCDLSDADAVRRAVHRVQPDLVFHLAGVNAFASPSELERINVHGFAHLTAALRETDRPIRLVTLGSAAEIGLAGAAHSPVGESVVCSPETPYGISKARITAMALAEPAESPLEIVVARPFNLLGPGLDRRLAFGAFAEQIVQVQRGNAQAIRCGRLDTRRDFIDVRDAVRALAMLAESGQAGQIYHICAGRSWSILELLETMLELAGVTSPLDSDPALCRAGDILDIYGDPSRLMKTTGWRPMVSLRQSLRDMLQSVSPLIRAA